MTYNLIFSELFREQVKKLDNSAVIRLPQIFEKLERTPHLPKALHSRWGYCRVRFLGYRITYLINETEQTVTLLEIGKRDEIYR